MLDVPARPKAEASWTAATPAIYRQPTCLEGMLDQVSRADGGKTLARDGTGMTVRAIVLDRAAPAELGTSCGIHRFVAIPSCGSTVAVSRKKDTPIVSGKVIEITYVGLAEDDEGQPLLLITIDSSLK